MNAQDLMLRRCIAESCLDRDVPLGAPYYMRPLLGPSVTTYYRDKHRRGEYGKYWPLHHTSPWVKP